MNKLNTLVVCLSISAALTAATPAYAGIQEDAILKTVSTYLPGTTGIGKLKVNKVLVNQKKKTITISLSKEGAYIPFTKDSYEAFKNDCRSALGARYAKYKVIVKAGDKSLENMYLFSQKKNIAPKEKTPFVQRLEAAPAPLGLDGSNIAMWQSHGWYFEPKLNRWEWQRARVMQTVEDLYTQSYVMPFLMPMLENAGAYVMSPRERDINTTEIIVDNDGSKYSKGNFSTKGDFKRSKKAAFAYDKAELHNGDHPFSEGTAVVAETSGSDHATATATWSASIPQSGTYAVYVSYTSEPDASPTAHYRIHTAAGDKNFRINQKMGGGTWIYLGHFPFEKGNETAIVELLNDGEKGHSVSADAIKIGGGMGNVARIVKEPLDDIEYEYVTSGYPRFTEGARYFLQWAGAPDSVFTPTDYVKDYNDDYLSRGHWVNWLAGGSSMLPHREGLNIPVDLSFAFHSDAGTTTNDSIIGTLGIYCTKGNTLGNGSSRNASRDLVNLVQTQIVDDVRSSFEPNWTRRGMWDESYAEARIPEVPSMLLELLSHQNLADMSYGLDPAFRFTVSRAIYKGMLKFLAHRDSRAYVVQPLPVHAFSITKDNGNNYRLKWEATPDSLEETAIPTYYIVEERKGDGAFTQIAKVDKPEYTVTVGDSDIHSYRIIAGNDGGISFASEVLALCNKPGEPVMIVNGFTRVSAPDRFDSGEIAGFYDVQDHGVPYLYDISYIGSQFEFRRDIPWMDDDAAGFGASRANYENKVIAGNTFDYVYTHGQAIAASGRGFVSSSVEAFCNATDAPKTVDLILGKQKEIRQGRGAYGTRFKTFPGELQNRIAALAQNGTSFFVSGAFVATDLWDNPNSDEQTAKADQKFATDILGYHWRVGQASVTGEAYQVPTRFKDFSKGDYKFSNELNADCYAAESPDSFYPADSKRGCTLMRYSENNLVAGTAFDAGNYRTVVIGFPFETIEKSEHRTHLMKQVLDFFADPNPKRK